MGLGFRGKGRFVRGGSTATHAYTSAGTYYAELLVTDRYGANATA